MTDHEHTGNKRRAACDECRARKLKCSGVLPTCHRCMSEGVQCVYSTQKKMGRPRKRTRGDFASGDEQNWDAVDPGSVEGYLATLESDAAPAATAFSLDPLYGYTDLESPLDLTSQLNNLCEAGINDEGCHVITRSPGYALTNIGTGPKGLTDNNVIPSGPYSNTLESVQSYMLPSPPDVDELSAMVSGTTDIPDRTCVCLSNMYLTLSNLSCITDFRFPMHLQATKAAMRTSATVIDCQQCLNEPASAMQNCMMITTLLTTIVEYYRKMLIHIDKETARAEAANEMMNYRMGDLDPSKQHMHTGTVDCSMGFNIELEPREWQILASKVVRADVLGTAPSLGRKQSLSVVSLTKSFEQRQRQWHDGGSSVEFRAHFSHPGRECNPESGDYTCLKLVGMIRHHVAMLKL